MFSVLAGSRPPVQASTLERKNVWSVHAPENKLAYSITAASLTRAWTLTTGVIQAWTLERAGVFGFLWVNLNSRRGPCGSGKLYLIKELSIGLICK
jgi:hypothetical protein